MSEILDTFILCFILFVAVLVGYAIEAFSTQSKRCGSMSRFFISKQLGPDVRDETGVVATRLTERVRELVKRHKIEILRDSGRARRYFALAVWRDFRKRSILIDYASEMFSSDDESFVVAHEIGHFQHYHIIFSALVQAVSVAGPLILLRKTFDLPMETIFLICVPIYVLVSVIFYYGLQRYVSLLVEYDADDYGIRETSVNACISALTKIRAHAITSGLGRQVQDDLQKRIARVERLKTASPAVF